MIIIGGAEKGRAGGEWLRVEWTLATDNRMYTGYVLYLKKKQFILIFKNVYRKYKGILYKNMPTSIKPNRWLRKHTKFYRILKTYKTQWPVQPFYTTFMILNDTRTTRPARTWWYLTKKTGRTGNSTSAYRRGLLFSWLPTGCVVYQAPLVERLRFNGYKA